MKTIQRNTGPFREQSFFRQDEIERMCVDDLKTTGLYPSGPSPIRVERFIEKRFGAPPTYEELPDGVMGFTRFGANGVQDIVVSRNLGEKEDKISCRRVRTTLAHEAGHGLLHSHLFALGMDLPLFGEAERGEKVKVMCREETVGTELARGYSGKWWEYQANLTIGALLLPRGLVQESLQPYLQFRGSLGIPWIQVENRERAAQDLAEVFDVNPIVARIRISELYPKGLDGQLTL